MAPSPQVHHDRRTHPRIAVNNCMFDADMKFGRIIDISATGMSFYYTDRQPWANRDKFKGAITIETKTPIRNLPMETVSDFELPNNSTPGSMAVRRRSVRFGKLSDAQQQRLAELIKTSSR